MSLPKNSIWWPCNDYVSVAGPVQLTLERRSVLRVRQLGRDKTLLSPSDPHQMEETYAVVAHGRSWPANEFYRRRRAAETVGAELDNRGQVLERQRSFSVPMPALLERTIKHGIAWLMLSFRGCEHFSQSRSHHMRALIDWERGYGKPFAPGPSWNAHHPPSILIGIDTADGQVGLRYAYDCRESIAQQSQRYKMGRRRNIPDATERPSNAESWPLQMQSTGEPGCSTRN